MLAAITGHKSVSLCKQIYNNLKPGQKIEIKKVHYDSPIHTFPTSTPLVEIINVGQITNGKIEIRKPSLKSNLKALFVSLFMDSGTKVHFSATINIPELETEELETENFLVGREVQDPTFESIKTSDSEMIKSEIESSLNEHNLQRLSKKSQQSSSSKGFGK